MQKRTFDKLDVGTMLEHVRTGQKYFVIAKVNGEYLGVRTIRIKNHNEWKKVTKAQKERLNGAL